MLVGRSLFGLDLWRCPHVGKWNGAAEIVIDFCELCESPKVPITYPSCSRVDGENEIKLAVYVGLLFVLLGNDVVKSVCPFPFICWICL